MQGSLRALFAKMPKKSRYLGEREGAKTNHFKSSVRASLTNVMQLMTFLVNKVINIDMLPNKIQLGGLISVVSVSCK